ncbi:MAG: ATPase [Sphingomonas bacterium]|uniref:ATP12 family chaperone protein n=1 Tax=Sphingomonas bacterium TaxID=1895847 RepID=UPI00260D3679|nr:ATP12 family protein [Sphingomonas bacterium]MDB5703783.1 ATPase [Sphingomonas bacterium]
MKRFWKSVAIDTERGIRLDDRPVRTPGRQPLILPTPALAEAAADEWRAVAEGAEIDPRTMPLTGLANAAIDRIAADPVTFATGLATFGESDLLCYRADAPPDLVARQAAAWDPLLDWARTRYDVHFEVATGIMHRPQPPLTLTRLNDAIAARSAWELAGLSPIVTIGGSLVAALALLEGAATADEVWRAVELDEDWQAEQWGRDDLSLAALESRRRDFNAGVRFLELLA